MVKARKNQEGKLNKDKIYVPTSKNNGLSDKENGLSRSDRIATRNPLSVGKDDDEMISLHKRFVHGEAVDYDSMKLSKTRQNYFKNYEFNINRAISNACRSEYFQNEEPGILEVEENGIHSTAKITQKQISQMVDEFTSENIRLNEFGPYKCKYSHNGNFMLLAGARGHLSMIERKTKDLKFEVHVNDRIRDSVWLHNETRLAVSQKDKVFIYDNSGCEVNRVKSLHQCLMMDYLRYHFLLVCARKFGFLSYLDTSTGTMVADIKMGMGDPVAMCQNPWNAIVNVGHTNGTVSQWTPNINKPVTKMLCHPRPIVSLSVSKDGNMFATSDLSNFIKIWDCRMCKNLRTYHVNKPAKFLQFSERKLMAFSTGTLVEIWKDVDLDSNQKWRYLRHQTDNCQVSDLDFCPYEDILGVSHDNGFDSIIVPGSGEPNIDAWEANPYETIKQRRETEVKAFLDKIQPEHITPDNNVILSLGKPRENEEEIRDENMMKRLLPKIPTRGSSKKKLLRAQVVAREMLQREKRRMAVVRKERSKAKENPKRRKVDTG